MDQTRTGYAARHHPRYRRSYAIRLLAVSLIAISLTGCVSSRHYTCTYCEVWDATKASLRSEDNIENKVEGRIEFGSTGRWNGWIQIHPADPSDNTRRDHKVSVKVRTTPGFLDWRSRTFLKNSKVRCKHCEVATLDRIEKWLQENTLSEE